MLDGVRHSWHAIYVAEVSNVDVEGGASLVRLGVMNQQSLEVVLEPNDTIIAVVQGRLLQAVRQENDGGLAARSQPMRLRGGHCGMTTALT